MSYVEEFLLADRLHDLLAYGLISNRLTDEEVEFVEAGIAAEAVARHQRAEEMASYRQWLVETKERQREDAIRRDQERAAREDQFVAWHRHLELLGLAGQLHNWPSFDEWCEQQPEVAPAKVPVGVQSLFGRSA